MSLDSEKEERLEERFMWVCAIVVLVDFIAISLTDGSSLLILVFMLELIVLIGVAKKCGVDWAVQLLEWLLHKIPNLKK